MVPRLRDAQGRYAHGRNFLSYAYYIGLFICIIPALYYLLKRKDVLRIFEKFLDKELGCDCSCNGEKEKPY